MKAEFATEPFGAPPWLLDASLVAMAMLFAAGVAFDAISTAVVLGLAAHVFVSLYHGRFGRFRTVTWTLLFGGWTISFLVGFLGYVLPWGQMVFWLAAHLGDTVSNAFWESRGAVAALTSVLGLLVMLGGFLDVVALHAPRLRTSRGAKVAAGILALVVVAVAAIDVMHMMNARTHVPLPAARPDNTTPSIGALPLYSLLSAGPTKALGAALPPVLALLVTLWPWRRVWRFHAAPTRLAFTLLWCGSAAGWLGLGSLGAKVANLWAGGGAPAPEPWVVAASRALTLYELAFFAAAPLMLARFVPPMEDRRAEIF